MRLKYNFIACFACILLIHVYLHTDNGLFWNRMLRSSAVKTKYRKAVFHPQNERPPISRIEGAGDNTVFLLGVFSTVLSSKDAARRQLIRDTYLSYGNDPRICSLRDYMQWKDEKSSHASICKVLYTFVIGGVATGENGDHFRSNRPLLIPPQNDTDEEYDCTYLNVKENMNYGKSNAWWKYSAIIAESYDIDYVAKVDSDTMLSMPHFIDFMITDLPPYPYNVRTCGGNMLHNKRKTQRGHLYASGQFAFFSRDMASFISDDKLDRIRLKENKVGVLESKSIIAEDFDTGTLVWMHPYPLKIIFMNQRVPWIHHVKEVSKWEKFGKKQMVLYQYPELLVDLTTR